MSKKHLLRTSKKVYLEEGSGDKAWWYEESAGMYIVHEIWVQGVHNRTATLRIPWDRIRPALKRLDRPVGAS